MTEDDENGGFPYTDDDFDGSENKKIARMLRWTYEQLSSEVEGNKKDINNMEKRIENLEECVDKIKVKKQYSLRFREMITQIIISFATVIGVLLALLKFLG